MNANEIKKRFHDLSLDDRLLLLHELWEELADQPAALDLSIAEQDELERRYQEHLAEPSKAKTWAELKEELRSRH